MLPTHCGTALKIGRKKDETHPAWGPKCGTDSQYDGRNLCSFRQRASSVSRVNAVTSTSKNRMKILPKRITVILVAAMLLGCASPNMLPKSASDVDYSAVGLVKGSGWHDGAVHDATEEELIAAIRAALMANGLKLNEFSKEDHRFVAENPMNLYRWATYVNIYYRPVADRKFEVHVVALSVKDVNVLANDSESPLPPRLIASIQSALSRKTR